ncbi:MAG: SMC-Scp complex subunit ScpB [Bryobacteraceae bacterium]|jgi:segregation and condensation protein B
MQELEQEAELEPEAERPEAEENAPAPETVSMETAPPEPVSPEPVSPEMVSMDELLPGVAGEAPAPPVEDATLRAVIEAIVYVAEEPLTVVQLANALGQPAERVSELLRQLTAEFEKPEHGLAIREVAGGYKMATKAEHHDRVRNFVKSLKPPLKLSLAALETLAVIAYKQPVTGPEIMDIRGVQGVGVLKTLLDRKLIAVAGRKNVVGKPILYKTTREFLVQFGLKDVSELPSLKEFEEIRRMAFGDSEPGAAVEEAVPAEAAREEAPVEAPAELAVEAEPASDATSAGREN